LILVAKDRAVKQAVPPAPAQRGVSVDSYKVMNSCPESTAPETRQQFRCDFRYTWSNQRRRQHA
jgi:hypothetical protein